MAKIRLKQRNMPKSGQFHPPKSTSNFHNYLILPNIGKTHQYYSKSITLDILPIHAANNLIS
jgi:hypothetical protein